MKRLIRALRRPPGSEQSNKYTTSISFIPVNYHSRKAIDKQG
jgi:hypothetical protein